MAMRAALATMRVLQQEGGATRAGFFGSEFREQSRQHLPPYEMVKEVRDEGMLTGIEFQPPSNLPMRSEIETIHSSKAWNDALNLGRRAISL